MSDDTPAELREAARNVVDNLLPDKSGRLYRECYKQFLEWQVPRGTTSVSEDTMLVYFAEMSKKFKPSSLWAKYSMLKSTILNSRNVDIGKYKQLSTFMSKNSKGFVSNKSKILTPRDIEKFLAEAPDSRYLATKVALILGITGACRREELKNLTVQDIEHYDKMIVVKIPRTKNDVPRKFTVDGDFYEIIKKYEALRPENVKNDRFFLCLRNGKCTQQVIGINTFGAMPKMIAEYLGLDEPDKYTGHSFRRTSATMLADAGADLLTLKRHGGWKSDKVAMGYVEDSINNKKKICAQICSSIDLNRPSSSKSETITKLPQSKMEDTINLNTLQSECSNAEVDNKENYPDSTNITPDKKVSIQLNNCNVTFNIAKD